MTFEKAPALPVLYFTLMEFLSPGRIGSFGHEGTVQPHDENADVMIRGSSPTFVNSNIHSPLESFDIVS